MYERTAIFNGCFIASWKMFERKYPCETTASPIQARSQARVHRSKTGETLCTGRVVCGTARARDNDADREGARRKADALSCNEHEHEILQAARLRFFICQ